MKVAQFNFNDVRGGAARAAMRQHQALIIYGVDSRMHVLAKESKDPLVVPFDYGAGVGRRIARKLRKLKVDRDILTYKGQRPDGFEIFSDDRVHHGDAFMQGIEKVDVVNLHWVAGYCDYRSIFTRLLASKPVVWTLHDMNAFTGGCHYDHGCGKFRGQCGACPQLGSDNLNDLSRGIWERKIRAIKERSKKHDFCVVTLSRWLGEEARSSLFRDMRIEVIPHGLDTELYQPQDSVSIRKKHGISSVDRIVLFLASGAGARRKGFQYLDDAIGRLSPRSGLFVVTVGGKSPETSGRYEHRHLGSISDESELSKIYAMADVLVMPSIEDNLPLSCQEALACGTPVIGFDVGGIPDMVIENKTGILVPPKDARALTRAIDRFFGDPVLQRNLAKGAREHAVENYSYEKNAGAYRSLYESLK